MPEAEIADMIVEIRSVTQGVGAFRADSTVSRSWSGGAADRIVEGAREARGGA